MSRFSVYLGGVEVWLGLLSRSNLVCRTGVGTVYRLKVFLLLRSSENIGIIQLCDIAVEVY